MSKQYYQFGFGDQASFRTGDSPQNQNHPEQLQGAPMIPTKLYEVDADGVCRVSGELEDLLRDGPAAISLPTRQIKCLASGDEAAGAPVCERISGGRPMSMNRKVALAAAQKQPLDLLGGP